MDRAAGAALAARLDGHRKPGITTSEQAVELTRRGNAVKQRHRIANELNESMAPMRVEWLRTQHAARKVSWELCVLDEDRECVLSYDCAPGDLTATLDYTARLRADLIRRRLLTPPRD